MYGKSSWKVIISQHQYIAETQSLLKISLLCLRIYGKSQGQFLVVHKNLAFLQLQLGEFCVCTPKIQLTQDLKINDHRQRRVFADWILEQLEINPNFAKQIIFSDEAHFWMNGYVNKQNCRIWDANPREIHQLQMYPEKVTVWCGFWSGGIISPYFFQNEAGVAITVNDERYRSIISNILPKMDNMDTDNMRFQQDGATCYTSHATIDILHERFKGMVISRGGDMNWPLRSCDLMSLDFFLWGS